jgi:hypothetical protein
MLSALPNNGCLEERVRPECRTDAPIINLRKLVPSLPDRLARLAHWLD